MRFLLRPLWLLLLLPLSAHTALYEDVKSLVEQELSTESTEEEVAQYVSAVHFEKRGALPEHVQSAVGGSWNAMCQPLKLNVVDCETLGKEMQQMVEDEQRVRSFGRKFQTIAAGYEIALSELPEGVLRIPLDFEGIATMWGTGTGAIRHTGSGSRAGSGLLLRSRILTQAEQQAIDPILNDIKQLLTNMVEEERVGMVWRYRYGYRLVKGERAPKFPPPIILNAEEGTERQFLLERRPELEDKLRDLLNALPRTFSPPLSKDEAAYYVIKSDLPDGITLWARTDGNPANHPLADAGFQFKIPIKPVLPSLLPLGYGDCMKMTNNNVANCLELGNPILGGTYPPEPVLPLFGVKIPIDDVGLCSQPVARRGYLCRPIKSTAGANRCPKPSGLDPTAISLISCVDDDTRMTLAGPDVCRELPWRKEPGNNIDPKVDDPQRQCAVGIPDLTCEATVCEAGGGTFEGGYTSPKDANGHMSVCVTTSEVPATYMLLHELAHALQTCHEPPGFTPYADDIPKDQKLKSCCQREGEAYRIQCEAMARDGLFTNDDGTPLVVDGVTLNMEVCAELYTEQACLQRYGGSCFPTRSYGKDQQEILDFMHTMHDELNLDPAIPASCQQAIDPRTMDERVRSMLDRLRPGYDVCTPLHETEYANKIGNNLCYIGQCAEQAQEEYRIQGGAVPGAVGAPAYPWDSPLAYTPKGTLILEPPLAGVSFPPYNPRQLAQEMDLALCQVIGLPSYTPPILCTVSAGQRAGNPLRDPVTTVQSIITQQAQQRDESSAVLTGMPGYGARIGAALYGQYLHEAVRSLAGILDIANQLFDDIESIDFPTEMCPMDAKLPSSAASSQ